MDVLQMYSLGMCLNFDSIRVSFVKQDNVNEVQFVNIFNG